MALSLGTLASGADFIITMLPADHHVMEAYTGPDGILKYIINHIFIGLYYTTLYY